MLRFHSRKTVPSCAFALCLSCGNDDARQATSTVVATSTGGFASSAPREAADGGSSTGKVGGSGGDASTGDGPDSDEVAVDASPLFELVPYLDCVSFSDSESEVVTWVTFLDFERDGAFREAEIRNDGTLLASDGDQVVRVESGGEVVLLVTGSEENKASPVLAPGGKAFLARGEYWNADGVAQDFWPPLDTVDAGGAVVREVSTRFVGREGQLLSEIESIDSQGEGALELRLHALDGMELLLLSPEKRPTSLLIAPTGDVIVMVGEKTSEPGQFVTATPLTGEVDWSLQWTESRKLDGSPIEASLLALSDGGTVALVQRKNTLHFIRSGQLSRSYSMSRAMWDSAMSRSGEWVAYSLSKPGNVEIFRNAQFAHSLIVDSTYVLSLAIEDGGWVALGAGPENEGLQSTVQLFDPSGNLQLRCETAPDNDPYRPQLRFSDNGRFLLAIVKDGLAVGQLQK